MPYSTPATSKAPQLIIYLLDVSSSMASSINQTSKIELVIKALEKTIIRMIMRSTKGKALSPRYRVAMIAYGTEVFDLLGGIQSIHRVAELGVPQLIPSGQTNTASAFLHAEKLLLSEIPNLADCPAPLICHMTDGEYTGNDPEPIVKRIMQMAVPDGNILVENIFISENILKEPIDDIRYWKGVTSATELADKYAKKLFSMSSPLQESYHNIMQEMGFALAPNAKMLIPGINPELVDIGFAMSAATAVAKWSPQ